MKPTAFLNARLVDPASGYDGPGHLLVRDGRIADVVHGPSPGPVSADAEIVDCDGDVLAPGLIDLRVKTGEPGNEPKETLKSAARAAAAGGVTTIVLQPDTDPPADEPAVIDFVRRRGRDLNLVDIHVAGAATRGLEGRRIAELGLMSEAGAAYFTDADRVIADTGVLRRVLTYARTFGALVAHRPHDPWLAAGACATSGEMAAIMGLPSVPAAAERIGLDRDLALVELTRARFLVDQISTEGALESLRRAKDKGLDVRATCSVNHLSFNEIDIGDYRTFYRLDPPLRSEADRQALIEAVREGLVDCVVSAHDPRPAEEKRLPFSEASPGAVGLETLLPALLALHHSAGLSLVEALRGATVAPADLLGLPSGRLAKGAPANLVLFNLDAAWILDAQTLVSKSKNSPFDGRRLEGRVRRVLVEGRTAFAS